jgi:hypothetical protein
MSATQNTSTPVASAPASKRAAAWNHLKRAGRLALILWLLWFGGWTAVTLKELLGDDAAESAAAAPGSDPAGVIDSLAALDEGGRWAFIDGPWSIGVVTLSTNEFAPYWAKSPADPTEFADVGEVETTVLDLVRSMELIPEADGPRTHYRYEASGILAEVSTLEVAGRPRLCWGRLAMSTTPGEWKVMETRAGSAAVAGHEASVVPTPAGTQRLAARYDAAGTLRGEFLLVNGPAAQLLEHWRTTGCRVTAVDLEDSTPIRRYLLSVAGRPVHTVVWDSQTPGHTMLLALPMSQTVPHR